MTGKPRDHDTIYFGPGTTARCASAALRLTRPGGPLNLWTVPSWLRAHGLTYHARPSRWTGDGALDSAKRGQEFITDIGDDIEAMRWLEAIVAEIER